MFFRILGKSITKRKGSIVIALLAVIVGAAVPAAMFTVSLDVEENVNREFRKFGANLLLIPRSETIDIGIGGVQFGSVTEQKYILESDLYKIKTISFNKNIHGYAPSLYQVVNAQGETSGQQVVLIGTWFRKETLLEDGKVFRTGVRDVNPWWDVEGDWVRDSTMNSTDDHGERSAGGEGNAESSRADCMIGISVAEKLGLEIGDTFSVRYRDRSDDLANETHANLTVVGVVSSGGEADSSILVDLDLAQSMTNRSNMVHTVQVSALCIDCPVDTFAQEIEEKMPYVEAKTVKQLTSAEMSVLNKIENMMFLVTIVALFASAMGVSTTMSATVISRRNEIGLMKSIGAENNRIAALFLMEAVVIGTLGGIVGFSLGYLLAQFLGNSIFDTPVSLHLSVLPYVMAISVGVALIASAVPVRRAMAIEPIIVLRGE